MNITEKAKTELDKRLQRVEDFIANKGVGSAYLSRAKRVQRNVNLGLFLGGMLTVAGLTAWALLNNSSEES